MAKYANYNDYILGQQEFAQPILSYLRECVNEGCPEVKEEFKWNFPCFTYKGSILAFMSGFKEHATFGFWLAQQMNDSEKIFQKEEKTGMGQFGKITSLEQLPPKEILLRYLLEARELIDQGKKLKVNKVSAKKQHDTPQILLDALANNTIANAGFENLSPSQRTEYVEWISEAKTDATRSKRTTQTLLWLEEGKPRNWKYMKKKWQTS